MKINYVISLHYHPGLKAEIDLFLKKYNANFFGDKQYEFNNYETSILSIFSSNQRLIFYNTSIGNLFFLFLKFFFKNNEIIYCFHEPILPLSIKNSLFDNIKCCVVNSIHFVFFIFSEKIIVFSECGKNKVPVFFRSKIDIQKLPFDVESLSDYRNISYNNYGKKDMLNILFYGNVNSGKNPYQFIDLFKNYTENNFIVSIVTSSERYYNYLNSLNNDYIKSIFKNKLSDDDIVSLILSTDIILLPHRRCTQSAIFEKSTYLGKPILFGPCEGFNEFIGIYGLNFGINEIEFKSNLKLMYNNFEIYRHNCFQRHVKI
jgi:hypothetical protein